MSALNDPAAFQRANVALRALLELDDRERAEALANYESADPALAKTLRKLLDLALDPRAVLATEVVQAMLPSNAAVGLRLGDWTLQAPLGRGGNAEVWLALGSGTHRDQRAAIKRPLADGNSQHFERERRHLAQLSDAGVVRLIDSGVDADGEPWLAMEYVDGERIDRWCDVRRLSVGERVALLQQVALSVHGAHRALLVHRDIKPANVLVTGTDRPQVKLVDFGIAKDLSQDDAPTLPLAMTPQYASPEQLRGDSITIASDVYQLGLLCFELLTGLRPAFRAGPGTPLLAMTQALARADAKVAELRRVSMASLQRILPGDLQAIVDLATRAEPEHRYGSALQMAEDLEAWLQGLPVRARRGGWRYRLGRFLSRHRYAVAACAGLIMLSLVLAVLYALQSRDLAQRAAENVAVRDTLILMLKQADPLFSGRPEVNASPWLDPAIELARTELATQPALLAEVLTIAANVAMRKGDYAIAEARLREALPLAAPEQRVNTLGRLGEMLHYQARYAEAAAELEAAMQAWRPTREGLNVPRAYFDVLHSRGDYLQAASVLAEIKVPPDSYAGAILLRDQGILARDSAALVQADELLTRSVSTLQAIKADRMSLATVQLARARLHVLRGDGTQAMRDAEAALEGALLAYPNAHPVPGMARHQLAMAKYLLGQAIEAEQLLTQVLERDYASMQAGNVLIAYARVDRARVRMALKQTAGAVQDLGLAEQVFRRIQMPPHPRLSEVLWLQAQLAQAAGLPTDALRRDCVAVRAERFGTAHPLTREAEAWVASLTQSQAATGRD